MPSILIINPNSTESITKGIEALVNSFSFSQTKYDYFTAPSGPGSLNNMEDVAASTELCLPHLVPLLNQYDGFLVACYSEHSLVSALKSQPAILEGRKPVTGIFEASISASLQLVGHKPQFGIITTGKAWETILADSVYKYIGTESSSKFAGVEATGMSGIDVHNGPAAEVERRVIEATRRLVWKGNVGVICLGCVCMTGMAEIVREVCLAELGDEEGGAVTIVDGVQAGVAFLEGAVRARN
ncbi:Asp/Glu/hydantoin racemase [Rhodofomes roseus]|uniref:Asp/Glu/hydantoin racemase n=1 Tax=Rhodofomes roseus TaxID=34475 RepID=A0A4Y9YH16_9APHY|nr:Asp/Glu/hydantoin racemase [Rhodofomes roseus]KAH9841442.1 Asp/Glu/hydantoin racemase [Rhodofomes roseus]TFY61003.1 hypothetical protein EVJ58_g4783 [Rhodofomes roseus]